MKRIEKTASEILKEAEDEFRNLYWRLRNARRTDWKAMHRARVLAEVMELCGVPKWAIKEARYCLRVRVCGRCFGKPLRCNELSGRAKRGDFSS